MDEKSWTQVIERDNLEYRREIQLSDDMVIWVDRDGAGYKTRIVIGVGVGRQLTKEREHRGKVKSRRLRRKP